MPRLPGPEGIQRAGLARDPGLRVPTRIPANLAGAAGGPDLGAGLRGIADAVAAEAQRQQQIHDATSSEEALLAFEREANEEFLRRSREADTSAPDFASGYNAWLAESTEQRLSGLEGLSGVATARLQTRMQRQALAFERMAMDTQIRAQKAKANDVFSQRVNQLGAQASRDPSAMPNLLEEVDEILEGFAPALGADATRDARTAAREDVLAATVGGLVEAGRYREAEALLASGDHDADLDAAARNSLTTVVERGRRAEAAELNLLVRDHIASIQATGQGIAGLEQQAAGVLEPEEMAQFRADARLAEDFHAAFEGIRYATPDMMAEQLAAFQPEPGTAGFAQRQRLFETLRGAAERELAARQEDPAAAAMRMPEVARRFEGAESLEVPLAVRLQAQANMGIPGPLTRALTNEEAETLILQIDSVDAAARAQQIAALSETYGRYWPQVYGELAEAGLTGESRSLVVVADSPGVSQALAQSIDTGRPELTRGLGETAVAEIRKGVIEGAADFRMAFEAADPTGGAAVAMNDHIASMELLALTYHRRGMEPAEAAKKAVDDVLLSRHHVFTDDRLRAYAPKVVNGRQVREADIEDGAALLRTREEIEAFDPLPISDVLATDEVIDRELTILAAVESGYWVTNETGTGFVFRVPFADGSAVSLVDAQGRRFEKSFEEVVGAARAVGGERDIRRDLTVTPGDARREGAAPEFRPRQITTPERAGIPEAQVRPVRRLNPELRQTARPFRSGEFIENEDGTRSTERTVTLQIGEEWINAPSLWMTPDGPVEVTDEDALSRLMRFYEERTGALFQRFGDRASAIDAARARSDRGGAGG